MFMERGRQIIDSCCGTYEQCTGKEFLTWGEVVPGVGASPAVVVSVHDLARLPPVDPLPFIESGVMLADRVVKGVRRVSVFNHKVGSSSATVSF